VSSSGAPAAGDLTSENPLNLTVGSTILELRAVVTAAEQVGQVEARGWDTATKKAIVTTLEPRTDTVANGHTPKELAGLFTAPKLVTSDVPHASAKDVENAAKALAERVAAAFTDVDGQARGDPALRAGAAVTLSLLGAPFDGTYVLTSTRHSYDADEGYVTAFTISGRQERSLLALAGGYGDNERLAGVVPGVVDDVNDPDHQGRVRVRFPWMADQYVSDWSRIAHAGAGPHRGFFVLPEVGDEVLVAFEQGEIRRPFVLGGLYNGRDTPVIGPGPLLDGSSHAVNNRLFTSRLGHQLLFVDASDRAGVVIATGDGKIEVHLDQANSRVDVRSSGDVTVTAAGATKIQTKGAFEVSAQSIKLEARTDASLKAAQVAIEGSGPVQVTGHPIQLN
jgi:phage baseplate assembly protein gpV